MLFTSPLMGLWDCKIPGLPWRSKISFHEHLENPGQSFLGQVAGNRRKRGFSANDHGISHEPDFISLPNLHHQTARSGADNLFQICQVFNTRADGVVDRES